MQKNYSEKIFFNLQNDSYEDFKIFTKIFTFIQTVIDKDEVYSIKYNLNFYFRSNTIPNASV